MTNITSNVTDQVSNLASKTEGLADRTANALVEYVNKFASAVESGTAFVVDQVPLVLQELLLWKLVFYSIICPGALLVCFICIIGCVRSVKAEIKTKNEACAAIYIPSGILAVVAFVCFVVHINTWLQVMLAPRVYLLEFGVELANKLRGG